MLITRTNVRKIFRLFNDSHYSDPELAKNIRCLNYMMMKFYLCRKYRYTQARTLRRSSFATNSEYRHVQYLLLRAGSRYDIWASRAHAQMCELDDTNEPL
jgi:hypothetical protein